MTNREDYLFKLKELINYIEDNIVVIDTKSAEDITVVKGMLATVNETIVKYETLIENDTEEGSTVEISLNLMADRLLYFCPLEIETILGDGVPNNNTQRIFMMNRDAILTTPDKMDSIARKEAKAIKNEYKFLQNKLIETPLHHKEVLKTLEEQVLDLLKRSNKLNSK